MPADLELFIVLVIVTFAEEFCGLAALDVHACYSAKGSINKYRNGLLNSSFCAVFVVLCLKQGSRTGNLLGPQQWWCLSLWELGSKALTPLVNVCTSGV